MMVLQPQHRNKQPVAELLVSRLHQVKGSRRSDGAAGHKVVLIAAWLPSLWSKGDLWCLLTLPSVLLLCDSMTVDEQVSPPSPGGASVASVMPDSWSRWLC